MLGDLQIFNIEQLPTNLYVLTLIFHYRAGKSQCFFNSFVAVYCIYLDCSEHPDRTDEHIELSLMYNLVMVNPLYLILCSEINMGENNRRTNANNQDNKLDIPQCILSELSKVMQGE